VQFELLTFLHNNAKVPTLYFWKALCFPWVVRSLSTARYRFYVG